MERRFLTLADVSDVLNISAAQAYALVRSKDLRAIKVGGRQEHELLVASPDAMHGPDPFVAWVFEPETAALGTLAV